MANESDNGFAHAECAEVAASVPQATTGLTENPRKTSLTGNRLGLLFFFDTNFVGDPSEAATDLRALDRDGWLALARTDTVDTKLSGAQDEGHREGLLDETAGYAESMGPMVWDSSRWGHSVFGNDDDSTRLDQVFGVLFPGTDRDSGTGRAKRKLRDAMHVATAIRYGAMVLITRDGRDLVSKSAAIAAAFNGFRIMTPEQALACALRMKARHEYREADPNVILSGLSSGTSGRGACPGTVATVAGPGCLRDVECERE